MFSLTYCVLFLSDCLLCFSYIITTFEYLSDYQFATVLMPAVVLQISLSNTMNSEGSTSITEHILMSHTFAYATRIAMIVIHTNKLILNQPFIT